MTVVVENWDIVWLRTIFEHEQTSQFRRFALERVWRGTVSPTDAMPRDEWVRMFRQVGFFDAMHIEPTPLPPRLRLYRGAHPGGERLMSWTDDPRVAASYGSAVWTCDVPASAVLAVLPLIHSQAAYAETHTEYVVDVPEETALVEADAITIGGAAFKFDFRGETFAAVDSEVRRFLRDADLANMRRSALAWTVSGNTATFYGAEPVLIALSRRYPGWAAHR